jgi:NAD+ kinase
MNKFEKLAFVASTKPDAQDALKALTALYGNRDAANADVLIALGGDGFMLQTLRRHTTLVQRGLPVYGMNRGTVGFLMNPYSEKDLLRRLAKAEKTTVRPLHMSAEAKGGHFEDLAFNEISLFRQTQQAAHISVTVDGQQRLEKLVADGILVATPAGSTAYNLSAHGPVVPLGSRILALTPISAFRPRRWRGALLKANAKVEFTVLDPIRRPVSVSADNQEIRDVTSVSVEEDRSKKLNLLFDPDHGLDEKILREQFST